MKIHKEVSDGFRSFANAILIGRDAVLTRWSDVYRYGPLYIKINSSKKTGRQILVGYVPKDGNTTCFSNTYQEENVFISSYLSMNNKNRYPIEEQSEEDFLELLRLGPYQIDRLGNDTYRLAYFGNEGVYVDNLRVVRIYSRNDREYDVYMFGRFACKHHISTSMKDYLEVIASDDT